VFGETAARVIRRQPHRGQKERMGMRVIKLL